MANLLVSILAVAGSTAISAAASAAIFILATKNLKRKDQDAE